MREKENRYMVVAEIVENKPNNNGIRQPKTSYTEEDVVGYKLLQLSTGAMTIYPVEHLEKLTEIEYTNLHRNHETNKLEGNFKNFPKIDIRTREVVSNQDRVVIIGKGIRTEGTQTKEYYKVLQSDGTYTWYTKDSVAIIFAGKTANMTVVRNSGGKNYLRQLPKHEIPQEFKESK